MINSFIKKLKNTVSWVLMLALSGPAILATGCNNYNLVDKLQNPGANSSTNSNQQTLLAFVGSVTSTGDMNNYTAGIFAGCSSAGFLRADCACQAMATQAGLPMPSSGKYIAFISAAANDMTCRITGTTSPLVNCTVPSSGGPIWKTTQGQMVANGYQGLLSGGLMSLFNITETQTTSPAAFGWTGTQPGGQYFNNGGGTNNNCGDWTITSVQTATVGNPASMGTTWMNTGTNQACTGTGALYCIGRP